MGGYKKAAEEIFNRFYIVFKYEIPLLTHRRARCCL